MFSLSNLVGNSQLFSNAPWQNKIEVICPTVTVPEPHDKQHLNFCKIVTSCHWSFPHYTFDYSIIHSSISGLPLIAKVSSMLQSVYPFHLNPSNYILIRWVVCFFVCLFVFAILYYMWSILRLWKTWFFYSVSIMFQKWEPFHWFSAFGLPI